MNRSTLGLPVHHKLLEFTCPSSRWCHPTISSSVVPFCSCLQLSQYQGLFKWVNSSHEVAKVLEFQLQHQSFQWTPKTDLLQDGLVGFPCSPRDSQESSPTPQFKSINSSALSFPHSPTLYMTTGKTIALTMWTFVGKVMSLLFNMLPRFVITFLPRSKGLIETDRYRTFPYIKLTTHKYKSHEWVGMPHFVNMVTNNWIRQVINRCSN